jgi:hypothetical protein
MTGDCAAERPGPRFAATQGTGRLHSTLRWVKSNSIFKSLQEIVVALLFSLRIPSHFLRFPLIYCSAALCPSHDLVVLRWLDFISSFEVEVARTPMLREEER